MKKSDDINKSIEDINKHIEELKTLREPYNQKPNLDSAPFDKGKNLGIVTAIKKRYNATKSLLINMELGNGDHTHFIAFINDEQFTWNRKVYIVDDAFKYYDIASKMYCLDYHEDFSLPIQRKIDIGRIKKIMSKSGITDVDNAFNPSTLKLFIESSVIQKILQGAELDKVFTFMKRMLIIILIVTGITLIIVIKASGILDNIKIPGFNG